MSAHLIWLGVIGDKSNDESMAASGVIVSNQSGRPEYVDDELLKESSK